MREGWEYKKLGEVCEIRGGSTPLRTNDAFWVNGNVPWFTIDDIREQGKYITYTNQKITEAAKEKLFTFPKGTVMLCCTASLGACSIAKIEMTSNQQFNGLMIKNKEELIEEYLYYFSTTLTPILNSLSGKATINFVSRAKVEKILIPLPPLSTQQRIVSELDLLNHILDQKRQQLKEYDALAESIFYDMFGDPVENPKGYCIATLNDVCEFIKDGTHQTPRYVENEANGVKFLSAKDVTTGSINWSNIKYIPYDLHEELYSRLAPKRNDVLMCKNGTYGIAALVDTDEIFNIYVSLALLRPKATVMSKYLVSAINTDATMNQFKASIKGIGVPNLHLGEIKKTRIPLPPLSLQRSFASKIEAIEKQKQMLKESIKETETLFQSRMDYWFNA